MDAIRRVALLLVEAAERGASVWLAGNGGSASLASHFANDLVKSAAVEGRPAIRAFCLTDNVALLTAWSNDDAYEVALQRQLEALARPGDVFIGVSTSGRSPNVVNAAAAAHARGLRVVAFTSETPSPLAAIADHWVPVATDSVPLAEALFGLLFHAIAWEAKALREARD